MKNKLENLFGDEKKLSKKNILSLIRRKGPINKNDLGQIVGVSFPTISKIINELLEIGLIKIKQQGESRGGRKPLLYSVDGSSCLAIGVVIGDVKLEVILMNFNSDILKIFSFPKKKGMSPSQVVSIIHEAIDAMYEKNRSMSNKILGIGIATAGPLDRRKGIILNSTIFPSDLWNYVPICEMLKQRTSLPVFLENRARVAALAEQWYGIAKNIDNLVFIHSSYGIGAGIITNGRLIEGKVDVTGSLGHMIIDIKRTRNNKKKEIGSLLEYSTIYSMLDRAVKAIKENKKTILTDYIGDDLERLSFNHICQGAIEKDKLCLEIIQDAAWAFGIALSNFFNLLWPQVIVLGGEIIDKCDLFFGMATETARKFIYPNTFHDIIFEKSSLSEHIIAIGAATQVFDHYFEPM